MSTQIRVLFNDPPVHCIDVFNAVGNRAIRIRPVQGGATLDFVDVGPVFLNHDNLEALRDALGHLPVIPESAPAKADTENTPT